VLWRRRHYILLVNFGVVESRVGKRVAAGQTTSLTKVLPSEFPGIGRHRGQCGAGIQELLPRLSCLGIIALAIRRLTGGDPKSHDFRNSAFKGTVRPREAHDG
jgi:hypothetical protein